MEIETDVRVEFVDDKGDSVTKGQFETNLLRVNQQDIFNQIQAHVTECGEDYYEDNK